MKKAYNCTVHGQTTDPIEMGNGANITRYCPNEVCTAQVTYIGVIDDPIDLKAVAKQIMSLSWEFSPENLTCDGEASADSVNHKFDELMKRRAKLVAEWEKGAGRVLTVKELYAESVAKPDFPDFLRDKYTNDVRPFKAVHPREFV
jgi:hypothetical protein